MTTDDTRPLSAEEEELADLFMDLRLDGPAADGWTYQQTARHYARIIPARLGGPNASFRVWRGACGHVWDRRNEDTESCPRCAERARYAALVAALGKVDRMKVGHHHPPDVLCIPECPRWWKDAIRAILAPEPDR